MHTTQKENYFGKTKQKIKNQNQTNKKTRVSTRCNTIKLSSPQCLQENSHSKLPKQIYCFKSPEGFKPKGISLQGLLNYFYYYPNFVHPETPIIHISKAAIRVQIVPIIYQLSYLIQLYSTFPSSTQVAVVCHTLNEIVKS